VHLEGSRRRLSVESKVALREGREGLETRKEDICMWEV
jgi:hypothetical protein